MKHNIITITCTAAMLVFGYEAKASPNTLTANTSEKTVTEANDGTRTGSDEVLIASSRTKDTATSSRKEDNSATVTSAKNVTAVNVNTWYMYQLPIVR